MKQIVLKAYAKLNLTLNVFPLEKAAKLHRLSSVMTSVSIFDKVAVSTREDKIINIQMPRRKVLTDNSAQKAAKIVCEIFDCFGADIIINKHIPYGGGLGGSSADAAAVLVAFSALYDLPFDEVVKKCAHKLGSDVAFMAYGGLALVEGFGEKITTFEMQKQQDFVIIKPGFKMSTAKVYAMFDKLGQSDSFDNDAIIKAAVNATLYDNQNLLGNTLTSAAFAFQPKLELTKRLAETVSGEKTFLTGSGSCLYIVCKNAAHAKQLCQTLQSNGLRAQCCHTVGQGCALNKK